MPVRSGAVEPPQRDLGPRLDRIIRLGYHGEGVGRREGRDHVTPLPARQMSLDPAAVVTNGHPVLVALDLDAHERPTTVALRNGIGEDRAVDRPKQVSPTRELPDGRRFSGVRDLKQLLLTDERPIAVNLARQLTIYATGAPVRFSDRAQIEQMVDAARASHYGLRSLVYQVVQSDLFRNK